MSSADRDALEVLRDIRSLLEVPEHRYVGSRSEFDQATKAPICEAGVIIGHKDGASVSIAYCSCGWRSRPFLERGGDARDAHRHHVALERIVATAS